MSQFLITALWSTSGYNIENLDDKFSVDDIPREFQDKCQAIVDVFISKANALNLFTEEELIDENGTIEHNLWLTIHHHGAGFWDGDYEHGDALTNLAYTFPELEDELRELLGE
jgi:hypothetical protein